MTRSFELQRNTAWALAGNVGYAVCQWGILVAMAKLATAADLGRFALGLAITAPVFVLSNLQLRAVQATDARREHPFGAYLGLRLASTIVAIIGIALVAIAVGYTGTTLQIVLAVALAKGFEATSDVVFGLLQRAENLRRIALSMLVKGALSVLAVGGVLWLGGTVVTAIVAMAACWAAVLVTCDLPAAARLTSLRPILDPRSLAALTWLALPLGCVMGLGSLSVNVPRYALEAERGAAALGHFAAVTYLLIAASQPVLAIGAAVSPRLARHFIADRSAYVRLSHETLIIAAGLALLAVVGAAVAGPAVLRLAYTAEYAVHTGLLFWMAVAAGVGFVASALGVAVTAARRFSEQLLIAVLALVICAAASRWLIPQYGLLGAAWALLATEGVRVACLGIVYVSACGATVREMGDVTGSDITVGEASSAL